MSGVTGHPRSGTSRTPIWPNTIVDIHRDSRCSYGAPRVHAELRLGLRCPGRPQAGRPAAADPRPSRDQPPAQAVAPAGCGGPPGPRATPVRRRWPGPVVVHRHHRAPHPGREGLLRRGPRRLHPPGRGLVDRRPHALRAGGRRPADGHLATPSRARDRGPQRPRIAVRLLGLRAPAPRRRPARIHGPGRLLSGQLDAEEASETADSDRIRELEATVARLSRALDSAGGRDALIEHDG